MVTEEKYIYAGIMVFGVMVSSISQVMLKEATNRNYSSIIQEYLNPLVVAAYLFFFIATLCTIFAYRVIPLSMGPILESLSYVFISVFGCVFFKEKLTTRQLISLVLIISGIVLYSVY